PPPPRIRPASTISSRPSRRHELVHDPPTWYVWVVRLNIWTDHVTSWGGVGLGVSEGGVAPGSGTPGGNGFERDPMNAPTPAHARRTTTQSRTRVQPRTGAIIPQSSGRAPQRTAPTDPGRL